LSQAARELARRKPELRVLILSMHENERYFFEALRAGASDYVLKSAADRDLVEACRATMRGEPFLYPEAVTALIRDYLERRVRRSQSADRLRRSSRALNAPAKGRPRRAATSWTPAADGSQAIGGRSRNSEIPPRPFGHQRAQT